MQVQNKIPTSSDRAANQAAASALKQTLSSGKVKPGESLQTKLQDPKVATDVVQKTIDTTRGGVDVGTAVKSLSPDPDVEAAVSKKMKKRMKKEHTFLTFKQYLEFKDNAI